MVAGKVLSWALIVFMVCNMAVSCLAPGPVQYPGGGPGRQLRLGGIYGRTLRRREDGADLPQCNPDGLSKRAP